MTQATDTYTYTARDVDEPDRTLTFTLEDERLSVDLGPPAEQLESLIEPATQDQQGGQEGDDAKKARLRELALTLLQRRLGPFRTSDVAAAVQDDRLTVRAWYRARGLALAPMTLIDGRIDNPGAAQAFTKELAKRKEASARPSVVKVFDYWLTWVLAAAAFVLLFRRFSSEES